MLPSGHIPILKTVVHLHSCPLGQLLLFHTLAINLVTDSSWRRCPSPCAFKMVLAFKKCPAISQNHIYRSACKLVLSIPPNSVPISENKMHLTRRTTTAGYGSNCCCGSRVIGSLCLCLCIFSTSHHPTIQFKWSIITKHFGFFGLIASSNLSSHFSFFTVFETSNIFDVLHS